MQKLITCLTSFLLICAASAYGQSWTAQSSPNTKHLYAVAFKNATSGYAVGPGSNFIFTNNAGSTWTELTGASSLGEDLWTIDFPFANYGYVGGTNGVLIRTTNGANWSVISSPTTETILKLDFISESTGIMVGDNGLVMKTINSGTNWTDISPSNSYLFTTAFMLDNYEAWIAGSDGIIYKTYNGGQSWEEQYSGTTETIWDIYFLDAYNGFASATSGRLLKTTDGGENWTVYTIGTYSNHYFKTYFENTNKGWIVGQSGLILYTSNGGSTWSQQQVPTGASNNNLIDFEKIGSSIYVVGTTGTIINYILPPVKELTLITPNGGETLMGGNSYDITWTSKIVNNIKIEYSTDGTIWNSITNSVSATLGKYTWTVPKINSSTVRVRIYDVTDPTINDQSSNLFEIKYIQNLSILNPNGGEVLTAESIYDITWSSQNIDNIKLDFSIDGGLTWNTISSNLAASAGTYKWNIPNISSKSAKLRISDVSDPSLMDESKTNFEIKQERIITLLQPNGGEEIMVSSTKEITWNSKNIQKINILYSINGGINWVSVASNLIATTGTYNWAVPNVETLSAKIKIEAVEDNTIYDESDQYFAVKRSVGIAEVSQDNSISVYPNPSAGNFHVQLSNFKTAGILIVTSMNGKVVYTKPIAAFTTNIPVVLPGDVSGGLYSVLVKSEDVVVYKMIAVSK